VTKGIVETLFYTRLIKLLFNGLLYLLSDY